MYFILLSIGLLVLVYFVLQPFVRQRKHNKLIHHQFPEHWNNLLRDSWPLYNNLPEELKKQLQQRIQIFINEKAFYGCQGFEVNEHHKVLIAAQACLLIVNKSIQHYDSLQAILVYPSTFVVNRGNLMGNELYDNEPLALSGESWSVGKVIISWDDAVSGMINSRDGTNVVIHEFAHILDQESGYANGAPILNSRADYQRWSNSFLNAYQRLQNRLQQNQWTAINAYGGTGPEEFFAVVTEMFFEQPDILEQYEPQVYRALEEYFLVNPKSWSN